jgi:hypothetical protein
MADKKCKAAPGEAYVLGIRWRTIREGEKKG